MTVSQGAFETSSVVRGWKGICREKEGGVGGGEETREPIHIDGRAEVVNRKELGLGVCMCCNWHCNTW
jgi:hypothetical protein